MMTRPQNVLFLSECFVALSSLSKYFNFINSRRPCPPNSISHLLILAFFSSWLLLFYTRGVLVEIHIYAYKLYKANRLLPSDSHTLYEVSDIVIATIMIYITCNLHLHTYMYSFRYLWTYYCDMCYRSKKLLCNA